MLTGFENLIKAFQKAKSVIDKEEKGVTPKFYVKCLVELETFVNELWEDKEKRKNFSKQNSKSYGTLRQKLRKYNKDFELDIGNYKRNPEEEEKESESEEDSNDESNASFENLNKAKVKDEPTELEHDEDDGKEEGKFLKGTLC